MATDELINKSARKDEMQARAHNGSTHRFFFSLALAQPLVSLPMEPPAYWSPSRDQVLARAYRRCGLWATAVNIAVTRVASLGYELKGDVPLRVRQSREMLGRDWVGLMQRLTLDYVRGDNGGFLQIVRATKGYGSKVLGYLHLPASRCIRTGDPERPVIYMDEIGHWHELRAHQVAEFSDMPEEELFGVGLCATSRAYDAIYEHLAVRQYFKEKATGRRPLALDFITGIGQEKVEEAIASAKEDAAAKGYEAYMGTALTANPNNIPLTHVRVPLAELPNGFDQEKHTELIQVEFADALGLDPVDLNPKLIGNRALGAGSQAQVLDDKQNSKGTIGLRQQLMGFFNDTERWHPLPNTVTFAFSERDLKDQLAKAQIQIARASAASSRINAGITTPEQEKQLMVDVGDLPDEFLEVNVTDEETLTDEDKAEQRPGPPVGELPDEQPSAKIVEKQKLQLPAQRNQETSKELAISEVPVPVEDRALESLKAYATTLASVTMPTTRRAQSDEYWREVTKAFDEFGRIASISMRQEGPQAEGETNRSVRYAVTNKNTPAVTLKLFAGNQQRPEVAIRAVLFGRKGFAAKDGGVLRFQVGNETVFAKKVAGAAANDWFGRAWNTVQPQLKEIEDRIGDVSTRLINVKDVLGARVRRVAPPAPKG